jgi:hypothetical protein
MPKTFSRSSIAYSESGTELAVDKPDKSTHVKVNGFTITRPTGQGDASENIAPSGGIDDEIIVGVGSTSRNLFYTLDGETWTKWASPGDAYQAFVYKSGSQYNAFTLEGVLATGLEVHHWTDITGTPTDTRTKMGGSTSTSSEAYDRENHNVLVNGGDCTPGASGTTSGGDSANGWMHEADEIPLPATAWTVSVKFNKASIAANENIWAQGWFSASNRVALQFINASSGSLRLQVGTDTNVINLNQSTAGYADGTTYRVDVEYDGADGWTLSTYTDAGVLIESDTGTGSWSPGTTANGEFTLFGRESNVTSLRYTGTLSDVKIYDGATLIRDYPMTSAFAVEDGSLPANANWQDQAVEHYNGTSIFGYYANPGTAVDTYLYRSTDGVHFPENYTNAVVDSGINNHIHAVRRLFNFDAWVAAFGDQTNKSEIYSTDDGLTWNENVNTDETREQPIGFWDHPNGTDILIGYDNTTLIGTRQYDESGNITSRIEADMGVPRYDPDNPSTYMQRYAWINKPAGGLIWASRSSTNTIERSTLAVSTDGLNYTTIYQMEDDEGGMRGVWTIGDYIIGAIVDTANPEKFDRIQVRWDQDSVKNIQTIRVSSGATNLLSEDESTGATTTGSVGATVNTTLAAGTGGTVGDSTITVTKSTTGNMTLRGPLETTVASENITGIIYLKGNSTELVEAGVWDQSGTATLSKASLCFSDNWIPVVFPTTTMTGTSHRWEVRHGSQAGTEEMLAEVDRSALFAGANVVSPHPWVIGGTPQAAEILSETVARSDSWTETITLWTGTDSLQIVGDVYAFTYSGASSDASLVWDGANEQWRLDITGESSVAGAATYFNKNEQVEITVTVSASGTDFVVNHGGNTFTLNGAAKSDLYSNDIDFTTGDSSGANALWADYEVSSSSVTGGVVPSVGSSIRTSIIPF